eukprot:1159389-Pelagomonas_calceolata.AAC.2
MAALPSKHAAASAAASAPAPHPALGCAVPASRKISWGQPFQMHLVKAHARTKQHAFEHV